MEEWLDQKLAVRRHEDGKELLLDKYLTFGAFCSTCGGDRQ